MNTMTYNGYQAAIEYDDEAELFHGEVAGLRDVITFQGKSVAELKKAFRESIEDYLAFCRERGEDPEKPFFRPVCGEDRPAGPSPGRSRGAA